jgi:hypothetical protein
MAKIEDLALDLGLPTQQDKERIQQALLRYEIKYPGRIKKARDDARAEHRAEGLHGDKAKFGVVNKQAHGRVLFELPEDLGVRITKIAPLVFKDKTHLRWFVKNFSELLIPERY